MLLKHLQQDLKYILDDKHIHPSKYEVIDANSYFQIEFKDHYDELFYFQIVPIVNTHNQFRIEFCPSEFTRTRYKLEANWSRTLEWFKDWIATCVTEIEAPDPWNTDIPAFDLFENENDDFFDLNLLNVSFNEDEISLFESKIDGIIHALTSTQNNNELILANQNKILDDLIEIKSEVNKLSKAKMFSRIWSTLLFWVQFIGIDKNVAKAVWSALKSFFTISDNSELI